MAFFEALTNERRRNPVPAPDLEHPIIGPDIQLLDDRSQSLAHDTPSCPICSILVMVASYPPPGHSQRPEIVLRSPLNLLLKLAGEPTSPPQIVKVSSPTSHTYSRVTRPKGPGPSLLKK